MVDWQNERPFYEKFLIDYAFKRRLKLLKYFTNKPIKTRIRNLENYGINNLDVYCVGNSHLDSAWLWRKSDSREKKIHATFSRNVYHLNDEPFDNYSFTANASLHYEWIKEDFPKLYQTIKDLIASEKWEVVGGEYVENDCNIPSGESIVRQRLIGQRFNIREFGIPANVAWMDDVFGWPNSIPQILVKSGADYFYTNKFCYSHYSYKFKKDSGKYAGEEKFPFFHFYWQSPDGSKVLCTWSQHKNNFHVHLKNFKLHSRTVKEEEENLFNYNMTWAEMDEKCTDEIVPIIMDAYGVGDGGMGPHSLEIMEKMIWEESSPMGNVSFHNCRAIDFMKILTRYQSRVPIWKDELYLENHRGTLTSISMIKENNRTSEIVLSQTEPISVFSGLLGAEHFQEEILQDWKSMLFLQFHDILPGSSIVEVYRDAAEDYKSLYSHVHSCQEAALVNVAHLLKEEIKKNIITVHNTLGWSRSKGGYLTIHRRNYNYVYSSKMTPLMVQPISHSPYVVNREMHLGLQKVPGKDYLRNSDGEEELEQFIKSDLDKLLIYLPHEMNLGAFGIQNLYLISKAGITTSKKEKSFVKTSESMEFTNSYYHIKICLVTGKIKHISSNKQTSNIIGNDGIGYALYQDDKTQFDAWNIDIDFLNKKKENFELDEIKIEEEGPIRHTLLIKYKKNKEGTKIYTRLSFYEHDPKIYGETLINWQEDHKLLKLNIPTKFKSEEICCGNPYGYQNRKAIPQTVYQEAMIEYAYQQFATWEDSKNAFDDFGRATFYSQTKYGMNSHNGTVGFTLLKAANFEKPKMEYATLDDDYETRSKIIDIGFHRIPWALEFNKKSTSISETVKSAYEYNTPLVAASSGVKHENISFVSIDKENVLITRVKEMEKWMREAPDWFYKPEMTELPFIIRCVEFEGKQEKCTINFHSLLDIKKAFEVDLLERISNNKIQDSDVKLDNGSVSFTINPFEIKSILIVGRRRIE